MFISELRIENFRMFGDGDKALVLPLNMGLVALVGENDSGKTAVIDALRLALGTRDQEFFRLEETDFHQPRDGTTRRREIRIRCKFGDLSTPDKGAFAEYLTYEFRGTVKIPVLYLNWKASVTVKPANQRRYTAVEARSGVTGDGPQFDLETRMLLCTTYLRPLRDAERALSAGRGSRLSQILQYTKEVKEHGRDYDPQAGALTDPSTLSVLGIGDYTNALLGGHQGVQSAQNRLNENYLNNLSFSGSPLKGTISVSGARDPAIRLRQLLEKLELELREEGMSEPQPGQGLGSNNLLFMACELLVLGSEEDGFPLLLIEEPEAHLHPQRQLRLMQFLQLKAREQRLDGQTIQIIVTTHSPVLASVIDLDHLVLLHDGKAFPMERGRTQLSESDYGFLRRFLDATKANLFFARGLVIVEGDSENILLPTLGRLLGRDFGDYGVSIVNVGGTGFRRFACIYKRKDPDQDGTIKVPVACVTDLDVMPDCAPEIVGRVKPGEGWPEKKARRWRAKQDFSGEQLEQRRLRIREKASGQNVETFVANEWTLEYDLAYFGLAKYVWIAAHLAREDEAISEGNTTIRAAFRDAIRSFSKLCRQALPQEELASHVYAVFTRNAAVSKATAAQYLAWLLESKQAKGLMSPEALRSILPPYIVNAIEYVTAKSKGGESSGKEKRESDE